MAVDVPVLDAAIPEQDDEAVTAIEPAVAVPEQHALDAALVQACRKGFAPVAALLLSAGARPDALVDDEEGAGGAAALALAAAADSGDAVRLLIRVGGGAGWGGGRVGDESRERPPPAQGEELVDPLLSYGQLSIPMCVTATFASCMHPPHFCT